MKNKNKNKRSRRGNTYDNNRVMEVG